MNMRKLSLLLLFFSGFISCNRETSRLNALCDQMKNKIRENTRPIDWAKLRGDRELYIGAIENQLNSKMVENCALCALDNVKENDNNDIDALKEAMKNGCLNIRYSDRSYDLDKSSPEEDKALRERAEYHAKNHCKFLIQQWEKEDKQ